MNDEAAPQRAVIAVRKQSQAGTANVVQLGSQVHTEAAEGHRHLAADDVPQSSGVAPLQAAGGREKRAHVALFAARVVSHATPVHGTFEPRPPPEDTFSARSDLVV